MELLRKQLTVQDIPAPNQIYKVRFNQHMIMGEIIELPSRIIKPLQTYIAKQDEADSLMHSAMYSFQREVDFSSCEEVLELSDDRLSHSKILTRAASQWTCYCMYAPAVFFKDNPENQTFTHSDLSLIRNKLDELREEIEGCLTEHIAKVEAIIEQQIEWNNLSFFEKLAHKKATKKSDKLRSEEKRKFLFD